LQKVWLSKPGEDELYGDVEVDMEKSMAHYKKWNAWAKERETHPRGERRPLWFNRPLAPKLKHFYLDEQEAR
jgi:hypothetical protein